MSSVTESDLLPRLDQLTSQIASQEHSYNVLRPVSDEATKLGALHSSGHAKGLFIAAQSELYNVGAAIAVVFDSIVTAAYEPARDVEFGRLESYAVERFDQIASVLRSELDSALSGIGRNANWGALDEFEPRRAMARDELKARMRTRLESARNEENKAERHRRATAKYSAWTVVLSAALSLLATVGVQEFYKSKQDKREKLNEQRFAVRLNVQRALGPPLESVSNYLQILSASNPSNVARTQALLRRNLAALDAQVPLQIGRIAFAYDSATVDSVFAVIGEFERFYQHLDSLKTNPDSVERILPRAADISTRASSLLLTLGAYEN